jgi:hypothetical protein
MQQCANRKCREGEGGKPRWFDPAMSRTPQRFCCDRCRMAWNYQQRKEKAEAIERQDYADAVEEAGNGHVNGNAASNGHGNGTAAAFAKYRAEIAAATDLVGLGLVARPEPVRRRRIA